MSVSQVVTLLAIALHRGKAGIHGFIRRSIGHHMFAALQDDSAISKWCAFDLFLSQDFARSWKNLTAESNGVIASFWDFEWGASLKRREVCTALSCSCCSCGPSAADLVIRNRQISGEL